MRVKAVHSRAGAASGKGGGFSSSWNAARVLAATALTMIKAALAIPVSFGPLGR
jgi:hypothetical protein